MSSFERIVVRAPNWIGDVIMSFGALRDLRRNFSGARIEVVARPWVADLYRPLGEIDAVRPAVDHAGAVRAMREAADLAVLFTNSFGTALEAFRARVPERWGYATDGRAWLLTRRASVPAAVRGHSQVYYYRAMLAGLGLTVSAAPNISLRCPEDWGDRGRIRLAGLGPWLGLNPGAAYGSAKRWLPERFAALGDRWHAERGGSVAILGSAGERAIGERIAAAMRSPAHVLCGQTSLSELAGVIAGIDLLVTNDSGPMHMGAALGTPVVAVFGPTDWRETAPIVPAVRVVCEPVECAPCRHRECPIDHRCMTRVTVERVWSEAQELLGPVPAASASSASPGPDPGGETQA